MDLGLGGKVALVTGSTSGLGLATARTLAAEGASVVICGRRGETATEEAEKLPSARGLEADLTDPAAPERLVSGAVEAFGGLDILVGSTGGPPPGTALGTEVDDYDAALDLLVKPMVRLAHLAVPRMRERGGGRIVFVGSATLREPNPMLALSNSVRMAVQGFAKTLSKEVAGDGITVNCALPGRIATDRVASLDRSMAEAQGRSAEEVRERNEKGIPVGRYGQPAEFGALVAFLCSEQAAYLTSAAVPMDGGVLSGHW